MKFSLLLVLVISSLLPAQDTILVTTPPEPSWLGVIKGVVRDSAGQPIRHALILAKGDSTGTENRVLSDAEGNYIIDGLLVNQPYTLFFVRAGYEAEMWQDVMVPNATPVTIDFKPDRNYKEDVNSAQPVPRLSIVAKQKGFPLNSKYLGDNEIRNTNAPNMWKLIEQVRPGIIQPDYDICTPADTLSVYIDGEQRFAEPTNVPITIVTEVKAGSHNPPLQPPPEVLKKVAQARAKDAKDAPKKVLEKTSKDFILDMRYIGCADWDPKIGKRNVLWIRTTR